MPRSLPPLPESASVVIVGGGVVGTSAAFHLAEAGVDAVLIERAQLGSGSTSKAAGGVRTQFSDAVNVEIAKRSLAAFRDFGRRPGWEIELKRVGYLFALTRQSDVEEFERSVALQNGYGLDSRMLTVDEMRTLCPLLEGDDLLAGAFSPGDGHATPEGVVQGYAFAARAHGAHIRVGCSVVAIETNGAGQITEVVTDCGSVRTDTVICAAGAWSRSCGAMVGVDLPVTPLRRQILFTDAIDGLPADLPMTIDFESSFYFHREGPGLLMGMSDPDESPGFSVETTDDWIPALMEVVRRRAPRIADAGIRGGWAGLYEMTPDHNAIIGEAAGVSRFLYATGFSGHGFLQGPAVGEILRDMVLRRPAFVDISPLSVERFGAAAFRPEYNIV
ncbi:MAG TPA: FAD-binding oxidoreductase [Solirubrobacteraceae bacterium]|nr:FAD-binding oxidoreductase [Solirubrobacteraceae bacterium]